MTWSRTRFHTVSTHPLVSKIRESNSVQRFYLSFHSIDITTTNTPPSKCNFSEQARICRSIHFDRSTNPFIWHAACDSLHCSKRTFAAIRGQGFNVFFRSTCFGMFRLAVPTPLFIIRTLNQETGFLQWLLRGLLSLHPQLFDQHKRAWSFVTFASYPLTKTARSTCKMTAFFKDVFLSPCWLYGADLTPLRRLFPAPHV